MITLYTDDYFHIGSTHLKLGKPCQDYAFSRVHQSAAFAGVSDGCSSGGHTDVGSRALLLATASAVAEHWAQTQYVLDGNVPEEIAFRQKMAFAASAKTLGIELEDMLATCLYVYLSPKGGYVHVEGDGVVALKYIDGSIGMFRFEWNNNTPYYPAYALGNLEAFIEAHGGDLNAPCFYVEKSWLDPNGKFIEYGEPHQETLEEGIEGWKYWLFDGIEFENVSFVAVFSDGVTQIDGVDWKEAVAEFMAFKSTKGSFAKRRMIRGILDMQKLGKGPLDDIAYSVVRVDHSPDEEEGEEEDS